MITVDEAIAHVLSTAPKLPVENRKLNECLNYSLFSDVIAPISLPPFRQSAMDGYAVNWQKPTNKLKCIAEIPAGLYREVKLGPNEAARIFTGAHVPSDANLILMQEWVEAEESNFPFSLKLHAGKHPQLGDHIRPVGEQTHAGETAIHSGTVLNAASIGYLQSMGLESAEVFSKPKISLIITGNELAKVGQKLHSGQIYESNSITIEMGLKSNGFNIEHCHYINDSLDETKAIIDKLSSRSDVVILSGGVSVGKYDYVKTALEENGVNEIFYKVKQKPGKPIFFGIKEDTTFFALPGNPAAALTCLYEYVIPHLKKRSGQTACRPLRLNLPIAHDFKVKADRALFLKSDIRENEVHILDHQASSMLAGFTASNSLCYIPLNSDNLVRGELVEVHLTN